jgi:hypothetical protein
MYQNDYYDAQLLFEERLRQAEANRVHSELLRAAREYARRNQPEQGGLLQRIRQMIGIGNVSKQKTADSKHAHAL